jgi:hypothetical protein
MPTLVYSKGWWDRTFNLDPAVDRLSFFGEADASSLWCNFFASPKVSTLRTRLPDLGSIQKFVSADRQRNWLADAAEHFHEGIDGELGRFLIDYIGHAWT